MCGFCIIEVAKWTRLVLLLVIALRMSFILIIKVCSWCAASAHFASIIFKFDRYRSTRQESDAQSPVTAGWQHQGWCPGENTLVIQHNVSVVVPKVTSTSKGGKNTMFFSCIVQHCYSSHACSQSVSRIMNIHRLELFTLLPCTHCSAIPLYCRFSFHWRVSLPWGRIIVAH